MQAAGEKSHSRVAKLVALLVIVAALVMLAVILSRAARNPSTDAASIDADVVHVASEVGGRVIKLGVTENAEVKRGDLLFQIDPEPYQEAMAQARADLAIAEATVGTQQRIVSTQGSNATIAADQTRKAAENAALAQRTVDRLKPLAAAGYVPEQQLDQAEVAAHDAAKSLVQAREQQAAARTAVDTVAGAQANVQARRAALAIAERQLRQTTVRAPHDGRIVGLTVTSGEVVAPTQSLFTLIASDEWFSIGNFRETALKHVRVGDCATVYSLIDRARPMRGLVTGIGSGVLDTERVNLPRGVPYVERSLNWVRVSQRFPVRVKLAHPPADLVRLGASAIIEIDHGAACR
ncbi:multidrug transporter subunit MdtN [Sphingomonas sp. PR090111-T3T-6A]|uniref:multidrug transporter subunit MdtN n=1 Tax=Sphingomonas sp. PR090111-T3T-6A TaxID=685778 RepID=UPI0003799B6D|nr:multidrug transporter subunit MdtN [Sphingomonas sp. PR090111-T3T-6A]